MQSHMIFHLAGEKLMGLEMHAERGVEINNKASRESADNWTICYVCVCRLVDITGNKYVYIDAFEGRFRSRN